MIRGFAPWPSAEDTFQMITPSDAAVASSCRRRSKLRH